MAIPVDVVIDPLAIMILGFGGWRIFRKFDKKFTEFQEDWAGTPGRPGVHPRPGVMERLDRIEIVQADQVSELRAVKDKVDKLKEAK